MPVAQKKTLTPVEQRSEAESTDNELQAPLTLTPCEKKSLVPHPPRDVPYNAFEETAPNRRNRQSRHAGTKKGHSTTGKPLSPVTENSYELQEWERALIDNNPNWLEYVSHDDDREQTLGAPIAARTRNATRQAEKKTQAQPRRVSIRQRALIRSVTPPNQNTPEIPTGPSQRKNKTVAQARHRDKSVVKKLAYENGAESETEPQPKRYPARTRKIPQRHSEFMPTVYYPKK